MVNDIYNLTVRDRLAELLAGLTILRENFGCNDHLANRETATLLPGGIIHWQGQVITAAEG